MVFSWFDARASITCALALAEMVAQGYPASERKGTKKAVMHRAKLLDKVFAQANQFSRAEKPNFYKKAKLGNTLRWKLVELGFEESFVDDLVHQVMVHME